MNDKLAKIEPIAATGKPAGDLIAFASGVPPDRT